MADPPERPLTPTPLGSYRPAATHGRALPLGRGSDPDSAEVDARGRILKTTPLRALIDIAQPQLTLTVLEEAGQPAGRTVVFDGEVCRIGTHPSNDLTLEDPAVSRFHCKLQLEAGGWRVEDSGSMNGTSLQDLRVYKAALPPAATLRIGNSQVSILSTEAATKHLVAQMPTFGSLTGSGRLMTKLFALLEKVAASDINVFIHGESGTGKELVAAEIVQRGARADKPFVVVDCGAISPTLVESELFGHARGAFTGADRERVGAFEAADGGTVFLDEIGELPLAVQPKLLRALEQREIRRVGETQVRKVNVRVISATNRNLEREVNKGIFRGDLYFRIAVVSVRVPALRERPEDVPHLIRVFLAAIGASDRQHLFQPLMEELATHEWPGNVRELRNYVERSVVLETAKLSLHPPSSSVPPDARGADVDVGVPFKVAKEALIDRFERAYIRAALDVSGGNMTRAARLAGIDRMYLHRLVQKHGNRDQLSSASSPSDPASPQQRKPVE